MADKPRILLAEDDKNLGLLIKENLTDNGFDVVLTLDGEDGYEQFKNKKFDLCILDVMMPKQDGFTLTERIRKLNEKVPVLLLTARSLKEDKLRGFNSGADDYLTKPFDEEELIARVKALLRRNSSETPKASSTLNIGSYTFDPGNQVLQLNKFIKRLTERESKILLELANNKNNIVKREQLLISVWGENDYFLGRSLDVFITKLRKYLSEDPSVKIENIHKVGFILSDNNS